MSIDFQPSDRVENFRARIEAFVADGRIWCPAASDDLMGGTQLLSVLRAMNAGNIKTKGDVWSSLTVIADAVSLPSFDTALEMPTQAPGLTRLCSPLVKRTIGVSGVTVIL